MTLLQSSSAGGADRIKVSEAKGLPDGAVKAFGVSITAAGRMMR